MTLKKLPKIYLLIPVAVVALVGVFLAEAVLNSQSSAPPAASQPSDDRTIKEIMDGIVDPNADYVFTAFRQVTDENGVTDNAPKTDAQWAELRRHLVALQGAPDLLTAPGRKVARPGEHSLSPLVENEPEAVQQLLDADPKGFQRSAKRLRDSVDETLKAVDAKDAAKARASLTDVDKACEACHLQYFYPNDHRAQEAAKEDGI